MPKALRSLSSTAVTNDTNNVDFRGGRYGELAVNPVHSGIYAAADEGSVFGGYNPTIATGVTASVATQYSATASSYVSLRNSDTNSDAASGKRIYPLWMRFRTVTAPASATNWFGVIEVDNVLTRFTSGGSSISPVNLNIGASSTGIGKLDVGALTTVAVSSAGRSLTRLEFRSVIPVVGDEYYIIFGQPQGMPSNDVVNGTNPAHCSYLVAPVVLTPSSCLTLSVFGASNAITGWATEFEIVWMER